MPRVPAAALVGRTAGEPSRAVAARVVACRDVARARGGVTNARLAGARLRAACGLRGTEEVLAASIATAAGLSARGVERLLRVSRTIADLDGAEAVRGSHLEEAARFRVPVGPASGRLAS
jgi:magnesium chelatase family protein